MKPLRSPDWLAFIKIIIKALAGVAQWIEHQPANPKVTGSIPGQSTCLGFGARTGGN